MKKTINPPPNYFGGRYPHGGKIKRQKACSICREFNCNHKKRKVYARPYIGNNIDGQDDFGF